MKRERIFLRVFYMEGRGTNRPADSLRCKGHQAALGDTPGIRDWGLGLLRTLIALFHDLDRVEAKELARRSFSTGLSSVNRSLTANR